jgi:DNA polymerase I
MLALDTETHTWEPGKPLYGPTAPQAYLVTTYDGVEARAWKAPYLGLQDYLDAHAVVFMHNAPFDLRALASIGIVVKGTIHDTVVLMHHFVQDSPSYGLKWAAEHLLGRPVTHYDGFEGKHWTKLLLDPTFIQYALDDARNTYDLALYIKRKMSSLDAATYRDVTHPQSEAFRTMMDNGISFDVGGCTKAHNLAQEHHKSLEQSIHTQLGTSSQQLNLFSDQPDTPATINLQSTQQLSKALGHTGSLDKAALKKLAIKNPVAQTLLDYRVTSKTVQSFLSTLPNYVVGGRIHASYKQYGTVSGRASCSHPNLQQIPKTADKYGIRSLFRASEGNVLVVADYCSLEWTLLTAITKDDNLLKIYREGIDPHMFTAYNIYPHVRSAVGGCTAELLELHKPAFKKERGAAKTINYGCVYGIGARKLGQDLAIQESEAKLLLANFHKTYAGYTTWKYAHCKQILTKGYIETISGRRRLFGPIGRDKYILSGLNTAIQGSAADCVGAAMVTLHKGGHRLVAQVHDEIIVECSERDAEATKVAVVKAMQEVYREQLDPVRLSVDCNIGKTWADCK